MDSLLNKIVARLYREEVPFSRNKNFEAYQDPLVQQAARICRRLRHLEEEIKGLKGASRATLESTSSQDPEHPGEIEIRLVIETLEYKRTTLLTPFELSLLREQVGEDWPDAPPKS